MNLAEFEENINMSEIFTSPADTSDGYLDQIELSARSLTRWHLSRPDGVRKDRKWQAGSHQKSLKRRGIGGNSNGSWRWTRTTRPFVHSIVQLARGRIVWSLTPGKTFSRKSFSLLKIHAASGPRSRNFCILKTRSWPYKMIKVVLLFMWLLSFSWKRLMTWNQTFPWNSLEQHRPL